MNRTYLLNDVAKRLGLKPYQISYALTVGLVQEPKLRIANKRIFCDTDIRRLAAHFKVDLGGKPGKTTVTHKEGPDHE